MQGIDRILYVCYGNHAKASQSKETAEDLLLVLRTRHSMERTDLMEFLGFDPAEDNDVRRFDRLLSSLRGDNPLNVKVLSGFTKNGEKYYSLSREAFDATVYTNFVKSVRDALSKSENTRIKELSEKVERAEVSE